MRLVGAERYIPMGKTSGVDRHEPVICVFDRHELTRHYLCRTIEQACGGYQVRQARSIEELAATPIPSLILVSLDHVTPREAGARSDIETIRASHPQIPVAVLTAGGDGTAAMDVLAQGSAAWLSPSLSGHELAAALRLVLDGTAAIAGPKPPPGERAPATDPADAKTAIASLSKREAEVYRLLRQGKPNKVIAFELGLSENTVKAHVNRILKKLGVSNRTAVAVIESPVIR